MEKWKPSYIAVTSANWYRHYGEQCGDSFKKLGIKLPCDPATSLVGIYPEEKRIERHMYPIVIAALFTIARTCAYSVGKHLHKRKISRHI